MTLYIETNGNRYVWRTGDDIDDLEHTVRLLTEYANSLRCPSIHAQAAQLPIPTPPPNGIPTIGNV